MKERGASASGSLLELVLIVVVALGLALGIQAFLVKPYRIPSESMVPTLKVGQRVLVNRIGNRFTDPRVGDVIVFHPPKGSDNDTCGDRRRRFGGRSGLQGRSGLAPWSAGRQRPARCSSWS